MNLFMYLKIIDVEKLVMEQNITKDYLKIWKMRTIKYSILILESIDKFRFT